MYSVPSKGSEYNTFAYQKTLLHTFFASFLLAFSTRPKKHCQLYFIN